MDPRGSKQNGEVVNMTRAMEALSPWLNHPRRTIVKVEVLVVVAAVLLLLQLILGSFRRRWHNSFIKYSLQVCTKLMDPLIIYTLGTMQSSPVKSSHYPVWAGFLILASMGTTAVQQYDFHGSFHSKCMHALVEAGRVLFYMAMTTLLLSPNASTWDPRRSYKDVKFGRKSSFCVYALLFFAMLSKITELFFLAVMRYKKGFISLALERSITMDHIRNCCRDSNDGDEWKELWLSYALFQQLLKRRYFGVASPEPSRDDCVFKKLLPPQGDSFRTVEVELGFCYDFFFTKYHYTFKAIIVVTALFVYKIALIIAVGVLAIRKSLALETPNPIIEVHTSEADYIITLLVLGIALLVELVQTTFYLASDWVQVCLACCYVEERDKDIGCIGKAMGILRRFIASGALRKKMNQYSVLSGLKDAVDVSDAVKGAIARSLRSTYVKPTDEETSLGPFDWTFTDSQLEVMLIWHIATEYCAMSDDHRDGITRDEQGVSTKFSIFWASLIGQVNGFTLESDRHVGHNLSRLRARLIGSISPSCRRRPRNVVAQDGHRGVAVHLSRYCTYLIGSVPELLPYQEADIAELVEGMMEEDSKIFRKPYNIYDAVNKSEGTEEDHNPTTVVVRKGVKLGKQLEEMAVNKLEGTEEDHNPTTEVTTEVVRKGVKLGKQLEEMAVEDRWKVMEDFWADAIIHAAALPYTTKEHMRHLENGGEFLTHIWTLLAHAGILDKDQQGRGVRIPVLRVPVKQEAADLGPGPAQEEIA